MFLSDFGTCLLSVNASNKETPIYQPKTGKPMNMITTKNITIKDNDNYVKFFNKSLFRIILNNDKFSIFEL